MEKRKFDRTDLAGLINISNSDMAKETPRVNRENIPQTLPGLLRVLIAKGKLVEFADQAKIIDQKIQDPTQKTAALIELAEKYTKE